ncbi:hypothetical protein OSTOST_17944, partial [Ostertagia ostertagi]
RLHCTYRNQHRRADFLKRQHKAIERCPPPPPSRIHLQIALGVSTANAPTVAVLATCRGKVHPLEVQRTTIAAQFHTQQHSIFREGSIEPLSMTSKPFRNCGFYFVNILSFPFGSCENSCLLLSLCAISLTGTTNATSAWLCPADPHDQIIRIPFTYNCSNILPSTDSNIDSMSLNIFRPNTKPFWCKIVSPRPPSQLTFLAPAQIDTTNSLTVTHRAMVRMMSVTMRLRNGSMTQVDNVWSTPNELVVEWPSAPFGCCTRHTVSVSNCLMFPTVVYAKHGE